LSPPLYKFSVLESLYQTWTQLFNFQNLIWTSVVGGYFDG
jgi:hypothetical protein